MKIQLILKKKKNIFNNFINNDLNIHQSQKKIFIDNNKFNSPKNKGTNQNIYKRGFSFPNKNKCDNLFRKDNNYNSNKYDSINLQNQVMDVE